VNLKGAHGIQISGQNYIVPVGAKPVPTAKAQETFIEITTIIEKFTLKDPAYFMLILDACRANPFRTSGASTQEIAAAPDGLADGSAVATRAIEWTNFLTGYAAAAGEVAFSELSENEDGLPSVLTRFLIVHLVEVGLDFKQIWEKTTGDVRVKTLLAGASQGRNPQIPYGYGSPPERSTRNPIKRSRAYSKTLGLRQSVSARSPTILSIWCFYPALPIGILRMRRISV
jgi:hypothetical protein